MFCERCLYRLTTANDHWNATLPRNGRATPSGLSDCFLSPVGKLAAYSPHDEVKPDCEDKANCVTLTSCGDLSLPGYLYSPSGSITLIDTFDANEGEHDRPPCHSFNTCFDWTAVTR